MPVLEILWTDAWLVRVVRQFVEGTETVVLAKSTMSRLVESRWSRCTRIRRPPDPRERSRQFGYETIARISRSSPQWRPGVPRTATALRLRGPLRGPAESPATHLIPAFGEPRMADFTLEDVERFLGAMKRLPGLKVPRSPV